MSDTGSLQQRILIVDDVIENLHNISDILHGDYAVVSANDGDKAIQIAQTAPPDLILLDIRMPGMDGYEVLKQLKANPATSHIPVIFIPAMADSSDESLGLRLGAADYVLKPIDPDVLKTRIQAQLELSRFRGAPGISATAGEYEANTRFSILAVDDTPINLQLMVDTLSEHYHVITANNGRKAIEIVKGQQPPDLILLDIRMPEMDGYETCQRIKQTEAGLRIPVIFVSAMGESDAKIKGFALGAADFITKPFDIDEVRARIRTHIHLSYLQHGFEQQLAQRSARLLATTNRLQAILNAIPDMMFEFDGDGHYLSAPAKFYKLLPGVDDELLGKTVFEVLPPQAAEAHRDAFLEAERSGSSLGKQFELQLAHSSAWFELSVSRLLDPDSRETRFITLVRDISERKQMVEEQLRNARQIKESLIATVKSISRTLEMRDPYTAGHQRRVAHLCVAIGKKLGLSDDQIEGLRIGAHLHDIGKIQLPADILSSSRHLSGPEYELIKSHPQAGADIVAGVEFSWPIRDMILQHHERLDGSGYPQGLKGDEIILEARILAVADVVEAMSSHRPNRPSLGLDSALNEIEQGRDSLYDSVVVDSVLNLFGEGQYAFP